jgi:hypothetical protein
VARNHGFGKRKAQRMGKIHALYREQLESCQHISLGFV